MRRYDVLLRRLNVLVSFAIVFLFLFLLILDLWREPGHER